MIRYLKYLAATAIVVAYAGGAGAADDKSIIVQSTTSTANSGLYDYLLPILKEKTGVTANVVAVGTGLAALSSGFQSAAHTNRLNPRSIGWITISIISIAIVGRDISHPYQNIQDVAHRNFASRLWQEKPGQTTICLATNFPALIYYEHYMAAYYSYRALYTPDRQFRNFYRSVDEFPNEPLICVAFHYEGTPRNEPAYEEWMRNMERKYVLLKSDTHRLELRGGADKAIGCYEIFEFTPK